MTPSNWWNTLRGILRVGNIIVFYVTIFPICPKVTSETTWNRYISLIHSATVAPYVRQPLKHAKNSIATGHRTTEMLWLNTKTPEINIQYTLVASMHCNASYQYINSWYNWFCPAVINSILALGDTLTDPEQLMEYVARDPLTGKYSCKICANFSHQWKSNTRNHVESKHFPTSFVYACDHCSATFNTRMQLYAHRSQKHRDVMAKNVKAKYESMFWAQMFFNTIMISWNLKYIRCIAFEGSSLLFIFLFGNNLTFLSVGVTLSGPEQLLEYVGKDPLSGKYTCTICSSFFHTSKSNTRNHVESKHFPDAFVYSCEVCNSTFPTRMSLYKHRQTKHRLL